MSITDGIDQLTSPAAPAAETAARPNQDKLRALAAQFESLLISQMLREMRATLFDDDEDTGFASGPLSDTLYSELSLALSRAGGIGFGQSMVEPLIRQADVMAGVPGPAANIRPLGESAAALRQLGEPATALRQLADPAPTLRSLVESGLPLKGRVTSSYGWRQDPIDGTKKFHKGTDIALPVGADVPAARAGTVTFAGELPGYGLTVVVSHEGNQATRYAHLSAVTVKAGDVVAAGQAIARSGASGRVTGPHLHFELLEGGQPVDPRAAFKG